MWALVVLNFGANFTSYFQMNSMPTYYNEILAYPVQEIAEIFAISNLIRFGTGLSFSYFGDVLLNMDVMGVTTQRKYFCIFCEFTLRLTYLHLQFNQPLLSAHFIPGVILLCMCFVTTHAGFSAALDVLNTAIMGSINLTVNQNSQDLSPNFASTIYGFVNFTGSIGGFATLFFLVFFLNINVSRWIINILRTSHN